MPPTLPAHPPVPTDESDWRMVERGYNAHVLGEAPHSFTDPVEAVRTLKKDNTVSGGLVGGAGRVCLEA